MRTALDRGAAALAIGHAERASPAGPLVALAAAALLVGALFFGGASGEDGLTYVGAGAVAVASAAVFAWLWGLVTGPALARAGALAAGLLVALVVWSGVSVSWSVEPDRSWRYFNRGLVYVAFAVIGLAVGALVPRARRLLAGGLAVLLAGVVGWALLGKAVPSLFPDGARVARLRSPVGYWNALGLLCAVAVLLGLWLAAAPARRREVRAGGVLLAYAATVALLLTYSRGAVAAGVLALGLLLALAREKLELLAALVLAVVPAAAVAGFAFTRPGIVDDGQRYATRVDDGGLFALAFALGAVAAVALAVVALRTQPRLGAGRRRLLLRVLAGALAAAAVAGVAVVVLRGNVRDEFRNRGAQVTQNPGRLGEASSNNRWEWWQESWRIFRAHPLRGAGAGSFEVARLPVRKDALYAKEPHNVPLQFLAETGLVGFLLLAGVALAAGLAVRGTLRRLEGDERLAGAALAAVLLAVVLHALVDYDWDFVALAAPFFLTLGVLLVPGAAPAAGARRPLWALGALVVGLGLLYSLGAPWLAGRRVNDAYDALVANPAAAVADAKAAHTLDPLSLDPLFAWAIAEDARGNAVEADRRLIQAVKLQPDNPAAWAQLGQYELELGRGHFHRAYDALNRMYTLDPHARPDVLAKLDRARAAVNAGKP